MMKISAWNLFVLAVFVLALGYGSGYLGTSESSGKAPPLSLEGLLDEKLPESTGDEKEIKADNFACYVCHGNYQTDELVLTHGAVKIGCVACHGESIEHRNDEDNITPPDQMYALDKVDGMCTQCHEDHNASGRAVIKRWQERCAAKTDVSKIACTDCHFDHRLSLRTVRWDKETGKVLKRRDKPLKKLKKK